MYISKCPVLTDRELLISTMKLWTINNTRWKRFLRTARTGVFHVCGFVLFVFMPAELDSPLFCTLGLMDFGLMCVNIGFYRAYISVGLYRHAPLLSTIKTSSSSCCSSTTSHTYIAKHKIYIILPYLAQNAEIQVNVLQCSWPSRSDSNAFHTSQSGVWRL